MDQRKTDIHTWLTQSLKYQVSDLQPASADASFRRYFRAVTDRGTFVVMDAPSEQEDCKPFIDAALSLSNLGLHTPQIIAHDLLKGFIVLEDLGNRTYLDELEGNAEQLYSKAIDALIKIQSGKIDGSTGSPSAYSGSKLIDEMSLFKRWYIDKHLGRSIHEPSFAVWLYTQQQLAMACLEQPQVWVHRDFHSRNLMITESNSPGVIDFQDMVVGAIGYDLASIFKDCYIEWPRAQQQVWLEEYRIKAIARLGLPDFSLQTLTRWVDFAGLQRHLKVMGIFCRLSYRDGKNSYLKDLPLVAKYILEVLQIYPELETFKNHFEGHIQAVI
ncbi:MAG: aminoglycoside/choline kinase family phosphotransferase [Arenicella sp.]